MLCTICASVDMWKACTQLSSDACALYCYQAKQLGQSMAALLMASLALLTGMLVTAVALGARAHIAAQAGLAGPHRPAHWAGQQKHTGATVHAAGAAVLDSKGSHPVVGLARGCQGAQECILVSCCPASGGAELDSQHTTPCTKACPCFVYAHYKTASLLPRSLSCCLYGSNSML